MYRMRIRYYHTLYKREVVENVGDCITFKDGYAHFSSCGYKEAVELKYIIAIEPIED